MGDINLCADAEKAIIQDMNIQRMRIMHVFDRLLSKIEVVICIEQLTENEGRKIKPFFDPKTLTGILSTCEKYNTQQGYLSTISDKSISSVKDKKESVVTNEMKDDNISQVVTQLFDNKAVKKLCKQLVTKSTGPCKDFFDAFKELRNIMEKKLYTTSAEERDYQKKLGRLWQQNEMYKRKIKEMVDLGRIKDAELESKIRMKRDVIAEYKEKIEIMKENCQEDIRKIIKDSEQTMASHAAYSDDKIVELDEQAQLITQQYQTLLDQHLKQEKVLRVKRYKVETQLATWLAKYDQEIGELQKALEILSDGYNGEKALMDDLQEKYDAQDIEYDICMREKAEEEERLFQEKLHIYICNRSARTIQSWWRAILNRRHARKRGKKGKGKK